MRHRESVIMKKLKNIIATSLLTATLAIGAGVSAAEHPVQVAKDNGTAITFKKDPGTLG